MKNLIVYAHPNPESFNHAILETLEKSLKDEGQEVKVRDLYGEIFNPVLTKEDFDSLRKGEVPSDIKEEQELVEWADTITFIYPIWWGSMPALLKGYVDRVFANGFAYAYINGMAQGLLKNKKVMIINTMGAPYEAYDKNGALDSMRQLSDENIFEFCGMEVLEHKFFGYVTNVDDDVRKGYLKEVGNMIKEKNLI